MEDVPAHKKLYGLIKRQHLTDLQNVEKEFDNYAAGRNEFTGYHIAKFLLDKWKAAQNLTWTTICSEKESASVLGYAVFQYFGNKPGWQTAREDVANNDMRVYRRITVQDSANKGPGPALERPHESAKPGEILEAAPNVSVASNTIPPF